MKNHKFKAHGKKVIGTFADAIKSMDDLSVFFLSSSSQDIFFRHGIGKEIRLTKVYKETD